MLFGVNKGLIVVYIMMRRQPTCSSATVCGVYQVMCGWVGVAYSDFIEFLCAVL